MNKLIALTAFLALAIPATRAADDDAEKAAKKLEGTYELLGSTVGGKPDGKAKDVDSFTIKDGKFTIALKGGKKDVKAKFALDPSKKPAHIDITPEENTGKNEISKGIYQTKDTDKGLELHIAFSRDGGDRPKDFKGEGENVVSLKLFRKKEK